jgi:hypothetical protein
MKFRISNGMESFLSTKENYRTDKKNSLPQKG